PRNAVMVAFDLGLQGYDESRGRQFQQQLMQKVRALPGVKSAGLGNSLPLGLDQSTTQAFAHGKPVPRPSEIIHPNYYMVDPGYFRAMQTRLVAGRDFDHHDRQGAKPVAIVNQTLAAQLFPNENPVGKR